MYFLISSAISHEMPPTIDFPFLGGEAGKEMYLTGGKRTTEKTFKHSVRGKQNSRLSTFCNSIAAVINNATTGD